MTSAAESRPSPSASMVVICAVLLAYVVGFVIFLPRVLTIVDEDRYVSQALAFAHGRTTIDGSGIIIPPVRVPMISDYPPGTSLFQAPFVWLFGWRGAAVLSVVALIAATIVTAAWLREAGKSPAYALLVPGFPGALLFGRIAMSDMPAAALVAVVCWLLWRGDRRRRWVSLACGVVGGAALLFREPLVLILVPLIVGAVFRGKIHAPALLVGAAASVAARLVLSRALFGEALYLRDPGIGFSIASLAHTLPVYGFILLVMVPGGALLPFHYRGERRFEVLAAAAGYLTLYLLYDYDVLAAHGLVKGMMIASRFMIPLLPLLAWMAADVWPGVLARVRNRMESSARHLAILSAMVVAVVSFAIHPLVRAQEQDALGIVRGIFGNTTAPVPLITNTDATLKYLSPAYGRRRLVVRQGIRADTVPALFRAFGGLDLVFLDRVDSGLFRKDADENDRFLADLARLCEMKVAYREHFQGASLRVLGIDRCK